MGKKISQLTDNLALANIRSNDFKIPTGSDKTGFEGVDYYIDPDDLALINDVADMNIIWLSSLKGSASNSGLTPNKPKKTLQDAADNSGLKTVITGFDSENQVGVIDFSTLVLSKLLLPNTKIITTDNTASVKMLECNVSDIYIKALSAELTSSGGGTSTIYVNVADLTTIDIGYIEGSDYAVYVNSGTLYLQADEIVGDIYVETGQTLHINCYKHTGAITNNGTIKGRIGDDLYPTISSGVTEEEVIAYAIAL